MLFQPYSSSARYTRRLATLLLHPADFKAIPALLEKIDAWSEE